MKVVPWAIFFMSLLIMPLYVEGDQKIYRYLYASLPAYDFVDGYFFYLITVRSIEPIYYTLSWFFSNLGLPRDLFIAISNAVLCYIFLSVAKKYNSSIMIAATLVLGNFYFIALYTELERLKFGVIFLLWSLLVIDKHRQGIPLAFLAIMSHVQVGVMYASMISIKFLGQLKRLIFTFSVSKEFLVIVMLGGALLVGLFNHLAYKIGIYIVNMDFMSAVKVMPLVLLTLVYAQSRVSAMFLLTPILVAIFFVSGDRLNIFIYFIFLYYAMQFRRGYNLGILVTTVYFSYKSVLFIENIFLIGRGYS
jgi:hypothetical protein